MLVKGGPGRKDYDVSFENYDWLNKISVQVIKPSPHSGPRWAIFTVNSLAPTGNG